MAIKNICCFKKYSLLFILLFSYGKVFCQDLNVANNTQFANYLIEKKLFKEAIYVLESQKKIAVKSLFLDSVYYLLGNSYTVLNEYQKANENYALVVTSNSRLYTNAQFKTGHNYLQIRKYDSANSIFKNINENTVDSSLINLKYFSLSATALLKRDFANYFAYNKKLNDSVELLQAPINANNLLYNKIISHKKKSPFLAGLFSAIIPGSGKLYAGKKGEALGTFLPMAALGFLVVEAYNNGGPRKLPFIGFTTLFSVFYVSNIWGSVMSVNINKTEFNKAINNEITINMQLPINSLLR